MRIAALSGLPFRRFVALLAAGTLCLDLIVVGYAAYALERSHASYEKRALVATQNLSQALAEQLEGSFNKADLAVLALKDEIERQLAQGALDAASLNAFIARQAERRPSLDALRVLDAEGNIAFGTGVGSDRALNASHRDFFVRLRDSRSGELVVSSPMVGQVSGKWSIVLARRAEHPDGRFAGVVYSVILLDRFQKQFAALDLGPRGAVSLRDLELGTVVRQPEPAGLGTAIGNRSHSTEWPEKLKENPDFGSYFAAGLDQRKRALSYRRVAGYPFYIIVGLYPGDYLAEWKQELIDSALLVGAFVLVTAFFAWLVARAWERREADAKLREADRERMMLELHDGCIQSIYAIGLHLESARRLSARSPQRTAEVVGEAAASLNLVIQDLRAFIAGEAPPRYSDEEFAAELQRIIPPAGPAGAQFTLDVDRSIPATLKAEQAAHVLRIAQEAVSNVVRHAHASDGRVSLSRRGDRVQLEVSDNGKGIGLEEVPRAGLGLHHIAARARKLGGQAEILSMPDQGTRVVVEFPAAA